MLELVNVGGLSPRAACISVLDHAGRGELHPSLQAAIASARSHQGRKSQTGLLSLATLQRFVKDRRKGKRLVPKPSSVPSMKLEVWHALALEIYRRPQRTTYTQVHQEVVDNWRPEYGPAAPSYDQIYRFLSEKVSRGDLLVGRHTGSALRAYKPFQPRTSAGLLPWQFVCADGWNTHFRAPHPVTGEFVTYEIWHFHDVATRYVPPVSIGLTESSRVILKGIENAIRFGGRIRELMTDHTRSVKNKSVEFDPVASVSARAGFTLKHPATVGNSQANGISEKFNQWLDLEARELATYQNPKVMDELSFKRVGKFTAKMVKAQKKGDLVEAGQHEQKAQAHGKGVVFSSYAEAVAWINAKIDKFNRRPHRSLPKVINPETGRKEHLSPSARLQQFCEEGWQPLTMDEASLVDLFRTHVRKRVTRGMVSAYNGQLYKHEKLWDYTNGDGRPGVEVLVAIDPMEWERVWVKTLDGVFICEATFVAATGYSTLTAQEAADKKLMEAQIRHKESGIEKIQQRFAAPALEMAGPGLVLDSLNGLNSHLAALEQTVPEAQEQRQACIPETSAEEPQADPEEFDPIDAYLRKRMTDKRADDERKREASLAQMEAARAAVAAQQARQQQEEADDYGMPAAASG